MKKEIADIWVDALRSGKYSQTVGSLCFYDDFPSSVDSPSSPTFCCLGVLCDLYIEATRDACWTLGRTPSFSSIADHVQSFEADVLPPSVIGWSGVSNPHAVVSFDPDVEGDVVCDLVDHETGAAYHSLVTMNDAGSSFAAIASAIEANWETL